MFKPTPTAMAVAFALPCAAFAQESERTQNDAIRIMREEIRELKETYERRIESLERRLADTEAAATKPAPAAREAQARPPVRATSASESAFNPGLSLILQGTFANSSQDPQSHRISGFMPSGGEVGPPKRSFGLGETELMFSASIDPYFWGVAIAALTPDNEVEMEEAYFQTLALPQGFTLRGGRFFSGVGYQNEIHQHAWDFQDAPLAYNAFLGGRLRQDGVQLRWLAPTSVFVELGAEVSSGDQFPGSERNKNGIGGSALFGHLGGDIGASYAWRAGLSYVRTSPRDRAYEDVDSLGGAVANSFSGNARVWIVDAVLKWAPDGNAGNRNFKLQGEYFRTENSGSLAYDDSAGSGVFGALSDDFTSRQSGWYVQGVWQFMPRWRVGYRHDRLNAGTVGNAMVDNGLGPTGADFSLLTPYRPTRRSLMFDWSPTEFSRVRLQLAADKSAIGATDRQVLLQYIHSLGAHGAHRF